MQRLTKKSSDDPNPPGNCDEQLKIMKPLMQKKQFRSQIAKIGNRVADGYPQLGFVGADGMDINHKRRSDSPKDLDIWEFHSVCHAIRPE